MTLSRRAGAPHGALPPLPVGPDRPAARRRTTRARSTTFARELAEAVAAHADELDARIAAVSGDWPADRLGALERNILRIGIHELDEGTVPLEVVIDEAVTLAKRYASEDAGRLVNGILGAIAREAA